MNDISQELEWAERDLKAAEKTAIEAHERLTQAEQRVTEQRRRVQLAKRAVAAATPVDRTNSTLADGSPVTEDHRDLKPNGQQKGYVVLSAEERAKGFVRPVRRSYIHSKCGQRNQSRKPMRVTRISTAARFAAPAVRIFRLANLASSFGKTIQPRRLGHDPHRSNRSHPLRPRTRDPAAGIDRAVLDSGLRFRSHGV
jgi:hypothetical protein